MDLVLVASFCAGLRPTFELKARRTHPYGFRRLLWMIGAAAAKVAIM